MADNIKLNAVSLSCKRHQRRIFADISFQLNAGEMLLVQGENGCGKSSLLRLLTGLATPHSGKIIWDNQDIQHSHSDYWHHLHYLGHTNGIKLGLTIIENLQLAQHLSPTSQKFSFLEILDVLQLTRFKNTFTKNLSAGQKRRVALAKLFLFPKPLWILDEPLTALDDSSQEIFLSFLESHLKNNGLAVISSHHSLTLKTCEQHVIKNLRLNAC